MLFFEWFIAKRFFQAQRRNRFLSFITGFAILGVMIGTAALIITLTVLEGFEREIKEKVIGFSSHIQVQGFQSVPLRDYRHSINVIQAKIPGVAKVVPFVAKEAMIRAGENVDGIFLKGIDVTSDISLARRYIVQGSYISGQGNATPQIVIGARLANRLNIAVGGKVVVFGLQAGNYEQVQPRAMQFQVVGEYESGMAEYDDIYAYTSLESAQKIFQTGDAVTGYDILVHDVNDVDNVAIALQDSLGYPHYARTIFQLSRNLFSWVELQKKMSPILLGLIIIVATVNIIGTLLMFILEKAQAIGILKSLGAPPRIIQLIFFIQGMIIAVFGILLGNVLALLLCWLQLKFKILSLPSDIYYMNSVPMLIRVENFILVSVIAMVLCILATIVPSRTAAKLDVVKIFRFG